MDQDTTIGYLKDLAIKFRNARKWKRFHDPKNLSIALSIEASELQEIFLWKSKTEVVDLFKSTRMKEKIEEEIADIIIFALYLSEACDIDLSEAIKKKIAANDSKYPIDKALGSNKKYTEL